MAIIHTTTSQKFNIERIALAKDPRTSAKIDSYFSLPRTLVDILQSSPTEINDLFSAKIYLLKNLSKIKSSIEFNQNIESVYSAIEQFITYWLSSKKNITRLSFEDNCTIKADATQVWLPEIGTLNVLNPEDLKHRRVTHWKGYLKKFDLVCVSKGYFIEIPYFPSPKSKFSIINSPNTNHQQNHEVSNFGMGLHAINLFRALKQHDIDTRKFAAGFKKTNYSELNGFAVQGGLPSLGKKH
ncbi:MAG TPA: hypothetical protein VIO39_01960 [Methylotenera sp.]